MDKLLIAIAVAIPFMGYILFSDSFNKSNEASVEHGARNENVPASNTVNDEEPQVNFVPAGYRRLEDNYDILLDVSVLPGTLNSIWAEYGMRANNLDQVTPQQSNELGMGTAGEYGSYTIIIDADSLEPGMTYFYRIIGETADGETLYSGLNHFTAGK